VPSSHSVGGELVSREDEGGHTSTELLQVGRSTVYRTIARAKAQAIAVAGEG